MKKQFFRVKQLADQTFLRAEKSEILNHEELQIAEQRVEYLRGAIAAITKKIAPSGPTNDVDKIMKKTVEFQLAAILLEESRQTKECQLFQHVLKESGQIEQQLARDNADHEIKVEELVYAPFQHVLENEFPNVLKYKNALKKYCLDKDSASNRYNATKKETVKEDLEEADNKVEQSRDLLAIEMFNILSKENEFSEYILQLLKLQRGYHESALKNLETVIPQLEERIGNSPIRKVFGTSLHEHLRITGKKIAYPLEICISALSQYGILEEGLFRVAGSSSKVKRLKLSIDSGCFSVLIPEYRDAHVLASLLKLYLRELPEPLLTFHLYKEWVNAMHCQGAQRTEAIHSILEKLPQENRDNLSYLIQFLSKLSQHPENKMSASNIAIVLAPNLLWCKEEEETGNMSNCIVGNMLIEHLIKESDVLFPGDYSKYVNLTKLFQDEEILRWNRINSDTKPDSPKPSTRKKKFAPTPPHAMTKSDSDMSRSYDSLKFDTTAVNTEKLVKDNSSDIVPPTTSQKTHSDRVDTATQHSPHDSDLKEVHMSSLHSPTLPIFENLPTTPAETVTKQTHSPNSPTTDNRTTVTTSINVKPQHYQNIAIISMSDAPNNPKSHPTTTEKNSSNSNAIRGTHYQNIAINPGMDNKNFASHSSKHSNQQSIAINAADNKNQVITANRSTHPHSIAINPATDNKNPITASARAINQQSAAINPTAENKTQVIVTNRSTHSHNTAISPSSDPYVTAKPPIDSTKCSIATINVHRVADNVEGQIRHKERPAKPEVPARPLSLSKKPPIDNPDSAFKKTHCSLYNVADKMHPSIIQIRKDGEREPPVADNIAAKSESSETKSETVPCNVTTVKVHRISDDATPRRKLSVSSSGDVGGGLTKSSEHLNVSVGPANVVVRKNCDRRGSHTRAKSDGGLVDFEGGQGHVHVSRNPSKPTEPPPPPPGAV